MTQHNNERKRKSGMGSAVKAFLRRFGSALNIQPSDTQLIVKAPKTVPDRQAVRQAWEKVGADMNCAINSVTTQIHGK